MQQGQEVRNDAFYIVRDEHLALVELNFILLKLHVGLDLGEEQNAGEVKGIVYIDVNVEEGVFKGVRVEGLVKLLVVLLAQVAGLLGPSGLRFIDNVGLLDGFVLRLFAFSGYVHALLFFATLDGNAHEARVLLEQLLDFVLLQERFALAVDVQDDFGAAVLFGTGF